MAFSLLRRVPIARRRLSVNSPQTGHAAAWTAQHLEIRHPDQEFHRAAGSLGWAFPAAIGAKCSAPDRPVFCFTGDGGFYYHIAELETMARYGINVIVIVNNNGGLNQEKFLWNDNPRYEDNWKFKQCNIAEMARTMGCAGVSIKKPSEIQFALELAQTSNKPTVIDALTNIDVVAPFGWTSDTGCALEY